MSKRGYRTGSISKEDAIKRFHEYYNNRSKSPIARLRAKMFDMMYQKKPKYTLRPGEPGSEKYLLEEGPRTFDMIGVDSFDEGEKIIVENGEVIDRIAIVKMQDTGYRTNGYLVTSTFGVDCDACIIIHGYSDGEIGNHSRNPLSASFYCNSFLHFNQGIFDLTKLAQAFDRNGGGHPNACLLYTSPSPRDS